jgi:hypothetical protein
MKKLTIFFVIVSLIVIFFKKILVLGMMFVGSFIFPEASQILTHYCFGSGEKLVLQSDYIHNSPVVIRELKKMKVGQKKRIVFKQHEDWRLSYALNPFYIEKRKDKVIITQHIKFATTNETYTLFGPFKISDNIVHVFDCTPYDVYYEFPR